MQKSREVVRKYLKQQWDTMVHILGDPYDKSSEKEKEARLNFVAFEEALSFPYNQKLAYFPADISLKEEAGGTGRARGEFGEGSLIAFDWGKQVAAHQSAMLASLYARQEFIRAAARMPMTLFVGPSPSPTTDLNPTPFPTKGTLLTSEKFSRVVFSGFIDGELEYVAVVQLSRTYPQNAVVRMWSNYEGDDKKKGLVDAILAMKKRWVEIAGGGKDNLGKILFQRGSYAKKGGIPLLTSGLDRPEDTQGMYIKQVDSVSDMWANVIAATASDKHGDTNLLDTTTGKKLWKQEGTDANDVGMAGDEWLAAMLALRRIPYIVKNENSEHSNKDPFPHALTTGEAKLVKDMMAAIIIARKTKTSQNNNPEKSDDADSIPSLGKLSNTKQMDSRRRRVVFSETAKWW